MKQLVVLISVLLVVGTMGVFGCAPPASAPAPSPAPQPSPSPAPAPSSVTPAPTVSPAAKPAAQPVKPVEIKIVNWNALAKEMQYSAWDMIERLEKKSNGALKFKLLGGIEVIAGLEQYEAVQKGVVDLVWVPAGYVKGILPEAPMVGLSRMTSQERRAKGIYSILNELHQKRNVYYLTDLNPSNFDQNFRIFLNKMIDKPEDLKGLRIRVTASYIPMVKYFGGAPVVTSAPETYTGIERGLLDGYIFPADAPVFNYGMEKVTKYFVTPGFGQSQEAWYFNLNKWNSLPANLQELLKSEAIEIEKEWADKMKAGQLQWIEKFKQSGMKEIALSKDNGERLVMVYYDEQWVDMINSSPVTGAKLRELAGLPPLKK